jgi:hypothetical protein
MFGSRTVRRAVLAALLATVGLASTVVTGGAGAAPRALVLSPYAGLRSTVVVDVRSVPTDCSSHAASATVRTLTAGPSGFTGGWSATGTAKVSASGDLAGASVDMRFHDTNGSPRHFQFSVGGNACDALPLGTAVSGTWQNVDDPSDSGVASVGITRQAQGAFLLSVSVPGSQSSAKPTPTLTRVAYVAKLRQASARVGKVETAAEQGLNSHATRARMRTLILAWASVEKSLGRSFQAIRPPTAARTGNALLARGELTFGSELARAANNLPRTSAAIGPYLQRTLGNAKGAALVDRALKLLKAAGYRP